MPLFLSNQQQQEPVLVIAVIFRYAEVFSPVIFLKKRLKVPTLSKAQNHRYLFDAVRGMQQQPFRFGHHSFLYNLQRGRHTVGGK